MFADLSVYQAFGLWLPAQLVELLNEIFFSAF